ncbi:MAG: cysteine desulfurase NifS [Oligosphaeraceae bacterium]
MSQPILYLDNNATTCVAPEVFQAMAPYLQEEYANPSSVYPFAGGPAAALDHAREQLAALLGAAPGEIIFTSCGSESDNAALRSAFKTQAGRRNLVTTCVEHPAILNTCRDLAEYAGVHVDYLSVDSKGRIDLDEARALITEETALVSVMFANNETGNIYPIRELSRIAHAKGALFHTDAVQAIGKIPMDLQGDLTEVDFLSLSGHKFHAPKGVGVLYRRSFAPFAPYLTGGHQEHMLRAGTENVASIVGLGKAAELAMAHLDEENGRVKALRDRLQEGLLATCPDAMVNGDLEHRLPNTLNICFKYIEGESILLRLWDRARVCASSGSACTTGSLEPSHVLRAMGLDYKALHGTVRLSLSRYNTEQEIDTVLEVMPPIIRNLRELSPFGREA